MTARENSSLPSRVPTSILAAQRGALHTWQWPLRVLLLTIALLGSTYSSAFATMASAPCQIDGINGKYDATCFRDDAGTLQYWIFNLRSLTEFSRLTAITGYPAILKIQKAYGHPQSQQYPFDWETEHRIDDERRRNNQVFGPNRVSPFATRGNAPSSLEQPFRSWVVSGTPEDLRFPPNRMIEYPGAVSFETLRIPLYVARNNLIRYWIAFSKDCWAATGKNKFYDGCEVQLEDYVLGAAESKSSMKSYPTRAIAAKATFIAKAIDTARQFHEATRELIRYFNPAKWNGTGVQYTHLELDDIPPSLLDRIRKLDRDLNNAMYRLEAHFIPDARALSR